MPARTLQIPHDVRSGLSHRWRFIRGYLRQPHLVGAVVPSSRALARALCAPYREARKPVSVLEVGAGTGAVTRELGRLLRARDRIDICEISNDFADILEREVLSNRDFAQAVDQHRVRLLRSAVQAIEGDACYDFIISGLPFTTFERRVVEEIIEVIRRLLKPDGVLSYFEYLGLRRTSSLLALGRRRHRVRSVSGYLSRIIREHQYVERLVLTNVPPAHVRFLRFRGTSMPAATV